MVLHATRQVTQRCKHNVSSDKATVSTGGGPQERNTLGWVATVYGTVCYNARLAFFEISGWPTTHRSHPVASPLNARQDYKQRVLGVSTRFGVLSKENYRCMKTHTAISM
jgi:hypothetical protein